MNQAKEETRRDARCSNSGPPEDLAHLDGLVDDEFHKNPLMEEGGVGGPSGGDMDQEISKSRTKRLGPQRLSSESGVYASGPDEDEEMNADEQHPSKSWTKVISKGPRSISDGGPYSGGTKRKRIDGMCMGALIVLYSDTNTYLILSRNENNV